MLALRLLSPSVHPPLLDDHPLPVPQVLCLTLLACMPSACPADISSATGMPRAVVEAALGALIAAGYVGYGFTH